ncbi:unnamed protein product [Prorocentrum cordatum]|uniref:Spondin-like TSP1 domain-containing protein n=1 Tax=Prorocentrum cordatum TaxID=2364126 RepID=A0ABN9X638_9DINO|nr:unnamed protein product [Polarella glacialis]
MKGWRPAQDDPGKLPVPLPVAGRSLEAELEGQRQLQTSRSVAHACDGYDLQWAQCRGLPECGECSPVDCEFGDWGEWEDGDGCIGLRFRDRSIKTPNNECGQPCEGSTTESRKHETSSCVPKDTDCGWSQWSEWTPCASEVDQATRSRSVERQATRSGSPCVGPVEQTRACGAGDRSPAPCSFSPWTAWSTCSATCGEGLHSRSRSIAVPARDGGAPCSDALLQTAACSGGGAAAGVAG